MHTPKERVERHRQLALELYREDREEWLNRAKQIARRIAGERGTVCTSDIWPIIGDPPKGVDRRSIAAAFQGMEKVKPIRSGRRVCHNRVVMLWRLPR